MDQSGSRTSPTHFECVFYKVTQVNAMTMGESPSTSEITTRVSLPSSLPLSLSLVLRARMLGLALEWGAVLLLLPGLHGWRSAGAWSLALLGDGHLEVLVELVALAWDKPSCPKLGFLLSISLVSVARKLFLLDLTGKVSKTPRQQPDCSTPRANRVANRGRRRASPFAMVDDGGIS